MASDITCLDTEDKDKYYCDMQKNGGGWSLYVKIKGNYTFEDAKNCLLGTKINNSLLYCRVPFAFGKNKELWYQDLTTNVSYLIPNIDEKFDEQKTDLDSFYKSVYFDYDYGYSKDYLRFGLNYQHRHSSCGRGRFPGGSSNYYLPSNMIYMNYGFCGPSGGRENSVRIGEFYVR